MANRHECNECTLYDNETKIAQSTFTGIDIAITVLLSLSQSHYISAEVAYYISLRCVYCKRAHKKQQTIASFSQKLHKSKRHEGKEKTYAQTNLWSLDTELM